jgi:non-heme chloroperoxidase
MRTANWVLIFLSAMFVCAVAGVLAFDTPVRHPLPAHGPVAGPNVGDLPPVQTYTARDTAKLGYRAYVGASEQVVVLIHGSSDDGSGLHPLAKTLRDAGASVFVPVLRGHGTSEGCGDIGYIGELEDDLVDLLKVLKSRFPAASYTLIGFSAGGGFVLRVLASDAEKLLQRFIMISPTLPQAAPTNRSNAGGWLSVARPRMIALEILNWMGIDRFNGLAVVGFANAPEARNLAGCYSFRLAVDFGAPRDYLEALRSSSKPIALLVGGDDEVFYADRFAPLLRPVRPDLGITIVQGVGHTGMTGKRSGIDAVKKVFLDMTAPSSN